jgi:hypothetical protein
MTALDAGGLLSLAMIATGLLFGIVAAVRLHTVKTTDGEVVPADVQGLADGVGVSPDVYALARVGASEAGGQKRIAKTAVMWVVVNEATRETSSPLLVVLGTAQTFGPQGTGGRHFVASSHDPQPIDLEIADDVMAGNVADPTSGAVNFDSPRAYADELDADGNVVQTAQERADAFAAARQSEGKTLVVLDGVPETTFRFWGRA